MPIKEKVKFKCPNCGSENVVGWVERIIETKYYLNSICRKGTYLSKRKIPRSERDTCTGENSGYKCEDCGEFCNEFYHDYAEDWRVKDE